jgi:hypothetical protein
MDLKAHLTRQAAFSRATFGHGARTVGVCDHIRKELEEVEACIMDLDTGVIYEDLPEIAWDEETGLYREVYLKQDAASAEWVDVAILGLDGLTRAIWAANPDFTADEVAFHACRMIVGKQGKNEKRVWPDWRTADPEAAIQHVRGIED